MSQGVANFCQQSNDKKWLQTDHIIGAKIVNFCIIYKYCARKKAIGAKKMDEVPKHFIHFGVYFEVVTTKLIYRTHLDSA